MTDELVNDIALLDHILACIERIRVYTGSSRSRFFESPMVQDAVMRNLQTLAESTQRLSQEAKDSEPAVPWRSIAGFRNVLTHGYFSVDLEVVWSVVAQDLPSLEEAIKRLRSGRGGISRTGSDQS